MKGTSDDINLDYFRAEYIGRNMGAPVEFIAYANPPLWTFEQALSCSVLHGILPRPNDIGYPLELMSRVWKIFGAFPVEQSDWMPYWSNQVRISHEKVKVSYYRYTDLTGDAQLLAFAVTISASALDSVTVSFPESVSMAYDTMEKRETGFDFSMKPYGCRILFVK